MPIYSLSVPKLSPDVPDLPAESLGDRPQIVPMA